MCKEEISACCLDNRKRKIIIGDINGEIKVYNPLNGSYMKSCVHDIISVVVSLAYVDHSRRFLAGYVNGTIRLYDESNLDDCQILRNFDRFNFHSELTTVLFLEADRTVVTAGTIGEPVKLWEYDSGKCDMELHACQEAETIVAVVTLDPFPLIATSDSAGNILVWGSRGCKWRGDKVTGFKNVHPLEAQMEAPLRTNGPRRILPEMPDGLDIDNETLTETATSTVTATANATATAMTNQSQSESNGGHGEVIMRQASMQSVLSSSTEMAAAAEKAEQDLKACAEKWGPLSAATTLAWDSENYYFYTGDEQGTLRAFSFERIIDELDGESMSHGVKKSTTRDRRDSQQSRKASLAPSTSVVGGNVIPYIFGKKKYTAKSSAMYRWGIQAHRETIIHCRSTPHGILTSSTDNKVKMWNIQGTEVGSLLSCAATGQRSINWDLKLDINSIMHNEEVHLDSMLDDVEKYNADIHNPRPPSEGGEEDDDNIQIHNNNKTSVMPIPDDKKTKFSRTSLRKRIEMSSRLLGLDFVSDQMMASDDMSDSGSVSLCSMDDNSSMASSCSKSTKNALDEARNIHQQTGLIEPKKDRNLSVLQMKYKECSMNKMVQNFEERGISFPVLNNPHNPKKPSQDLVREGGPSPKGASKIGNNFQEVEYEAKITKKCKKFSTYKSLEKSLDVDHLPPLPKEERDKIRLARKEQRRQRDLKDIQNAKKRLMKQKSKVVDSEASAADDEDVEED